MFRMIDVLVQWFLVVAAVLLLVTGLSGQDFAVAIGCLLIALFLRIRMIGMSIFGLLADFLKGEELPPMVSLYPGGEQVVRTDPYPKNTRSDIRAAGSLVTNPLKCPHSWVEQNIGDKVHARFVRVCKLCGSREDKL